MRVTDIRLRPFGPADWDRLSKWLAQPEIERWWGTRSAAEAEIRSALQSASALCRIIEVDGEAAGYAQAIDVALLDGGLPPELPAGAWDADLFIASAEHRGRGVGQAALRLLAREVFATTLAIAISVFAPVRNEAAARAYEKAGFRWVGIVEDPIFGPSWIMIRDRPKG